MKTQDVFPRIITNGKWYRIETAPDKYSMDCGGEGACWIWETRFLWLAKRHLKMVKRDDANAESRKPKQWSPIPAQKQKEV